jgi:hypothetical protein
MPKKRSIHYQIDREKYKNMRPMDAIAPSELAAFEAAATAFYDKASPERKDVHPYESFLRLNFRLPDPDKEPDAYLVHGDDFERQVLILWGAEKQRDTSLTLIKNDVVRLRGGEETVADKLRKRLIGWGQMQKDALLLLAKTREPLFRFIGQTVSDEKGAMKGIKIGEVALPIGKTRPLRYLIPLEMRQFHKACQEFYHRAASATSLYERELRTNFQLPDPDKTPQAFRVHGSIRNPRLIVLWDGRGDRDKTIWLTSSPEFNIPPVPPITPEQEVLGQKPVAPPTLTDKLQAKTIPFSKIIGVSASIVGTPVLLALIIWLLLDKSPPNPLTDSANAGVGGDKAAAILVRFNKAIDPTSIPTKNPSQAFELDNASGTPVPILSAGLDDTTGQFKNREIELVASEDFADGAEYHLTVKGGLRDRKILKNQLKAPVQFAFNYRDNKPPALGMPSSDGEDYTHLLAPFTKKLNPASIHESGFSIDAQKISVKSATLDEDQKTVILTVYPAFQLGSEHDLVVNSVQDTAQQPNAVSANSQVHFKFVDAMPPKLRHVTASGAQNQVFVEFNKKLDPASATNQANYTLIGKGGGSVTVYAARMAEPKKVMVLTAPLSGGIDYQLLVKNIQDAAQPPNTLAEAGQKFQFTGTEIPGGPQIDNVTCIGDHTKVLVQFTKDKPLATNSIPTKRNFQLKWISDNGPVDLTSTIVEVTDISYLPDYPGVQSASLVLASALVVGRTYELSASGLTDIWGNKNAQSGKTFRVKGISVGLFVQGCRFYNTKATIIMTFSLPIDETKLQPQYFHFDGGYTVIKAEQQRPGDPYSAVQLTLDRAIESDSFSGKATVYYPGTSQYEELRFTGPDAQSQSGK